MSRFSMDQFVFIDESAVVCDLMQEEIVGLPNGTWHSCF